MYAAILVGKNNEATQELSFCNRSIYLCGMNSEEEEENGDALIATEKRPAWDVNFYKKKPEIKLY